MPVYRPQVWMVQPRVAGTFIDGAPSPLAVPQDSTGAKLLMAHTPLLDDVSMTLATIGGDYPAHLPSDEDLRPDAINWKVLDGTNWMATFDAQGVSGPLDWQSRVLDFKGRGLKLTPWVVPVGLRIEEEIMKVTSVLGVMEEPEMVLNVEYWGDQYFWQGGKAGIVPYCQRFRQLQPRAKVILQYDTRNPDTIHLEEWLPYVDQVIDMSYWPDFGEDMQTVLFRSYHRMKALGKPFSFTYPGTAQSYPDWEIDESPIYVFRRGNMTPACVQLVQSGSAPPLPPTPEDLESRVARLEDQRSDLYEQAVRDAVQIRDLKTRVETLEVRTRAAGHALTGS